jgi:hypothetical protein
MVHHSLINLFPFLCGRGGGGISPKIFRPKWSFVKSIPGVDVYMITISSDFPNFRRKNWRFSQKRMLPSIFTKN